MLGQAMLNTRAGRRIGDADIDWGYWISVLENHLACLDVRNVCLRGNINHAEYRRRLVSLGRLEV
jgi:hypothetical protein